MNATRSPLALSAFFLATLATAARAQVVEWTRGTGAGLYSVSTLAVDPHAPGTIWAGGDAEWAGLGLFRSDDDGGSWTAIAGPDAPDQVGTIVIHPENGATIFTGCNLIYRSDDRGLHWTRSALPGVEIEWSACQINALAVDPQSPGRLWAASDLGLSHSDDGGQTWFDSAAVTKEIYELVFDGRRPGTAYASSYDHEYEVDSPYYPYHYTARAGGPIFSSADGGESWIQRADFGSKVMSFALDPFESEVVYAGSLGAIYRSANQGASWQPLSEARSPDVGPVPDPAPWAWFFAIAADPVRRGRIYAATSYGVYRSLDGGRTWSSFSRGLPEGETRALAVSPDGRRLHAGTSEGVWELDLEAAVPRDPPIPPGGPRPPLRGLTRVTPAEPTVPPPSPTPTPSSPHLSGAWTGQVSLWGDWIHDCAAVEDIHVDVSHFGDRVSLYIPTSCLGMLWLEGRLSGTTVTFDAWTRSEEKYARVTGEVTSGSIRAANRSSNYGMSLTLAR